MQKLTRAPRISPWVAATGGNFGVKILSLAASVILARVVGPSGRGVITADTLWALLIINFASVIVVRCVVYFGGRYGREGALRSIRVAAISGLALTGVALLVNWRLLGTKPSYLAANVYALTVALSLVVSSIAALHLLKGNFGLFWLGEAVTAGCTALGVIILAAVSGLTPTSYAIAAVIAVMVSLIAVSTTARVGESIGGTGIPRRLDIVRYAGALGTTLLPFQINARIDQLVVSVSAPMQTLGYYSIACAWASMLSMLGAGFSTVILAESTKVWSADMGDVAALAARVRRATVVLGVICMVTTLATPFGLPLLYGREFAPAVPAAVVLSLAALVLYYNSLLHEVARGSGRPIIGWLPETAGLVISLALLKILYFRYGMVGAAVSSIVSYFAVAAILLYELQRSVPRLAVGEFIPTIADVAHVGRALMSILSRAPINLRDATGRTTPAGSDDA